MQRRHGFSQRNASEAFEFIEEAFDVMALFINTPVDGRLQNFASLSSNTILGPGMYSLLIGGGVNVANYKLTLNVKSTAVTRAVPEPDARAMMIFGMGAVGFAMRRRQKIATRISYAG